MTRAGVLASALRLIRERCSAIGCCHSSRQRRIFPRGRSHYHGRRSPPAPGKTIESHRKGVREWDRLFSSKGRCQANTSTACGAIRAKRQMSASTRVCVCSWAQIRTRLYGRIRGPRRHPIAAVSYDCEQTLLLGTATAACSGGSRAGEADGVADGVADFNKITCYMVLSPPCRASGAQPTVPSVLRARHVPALIAPHP